MKLTYLLLLMMAFNICRGQNVSVYCSEITLNGKEFEKSHVFQRSIESVLSNLKKAPQLIERNKLSKLLEIIQDENNLSFDLGSRNISDLNPENVDYVIFSNLSNSAISSYFNLQIECIKIRGESLFSKFVFPSIKLSEIDLEELILFENKVKLTLEQFSFVDKIGILNNKILDEINGKLENSQMEIDRLRSDLVAYTDYADIAEIGMDGYGHIKPGLGLGMESELIDLMKKVTILNDNKIYCSFTADAIETIDIVIQKYPRYPFGYYIKSFQLESQGNPKWREYAKLAIDIFEKTTRIKNVNKQHIEALQELKRKLLKF